MRGAGGHGLVEIMRGIEAVEHGGAAAAQPERQHEAAAGMDKRGGMQHHVAGPGDMTWREYSR